jgi:hypothetical protein
MPVSYSERIQAFAPHGFGGLRPSDPVLLELKRRGKKLSTQVSRYLIREASASLSLCAVSVVVAVLRNPPVAGEYPRTESAHRRSNGRAFCFGGGTSRPMVRQTYSLCVPKAREILAFHVGKHSRSTLLPECGVPASPLRSFAESRLRNGIRAIGLRPWKRPGKSSTAARRGDNFSRAFCRSLPAIDTSPLSACVGSIFSLGVAHVQH